MLGTVRARNVFIKELRRVRREYGFLLVGYVVMPNHVHLLMGEPKKGTPSTVLQMLKQRVSRKMRMKERAKWKEQLSRRFPKFIGRVAQRNHSEIFVGPGALQVYIIRALSFIGRSLGCPTLRF